MWENGPYYICEQRRSRWQCASVQSYMDMLFVVIYYHIHWLCKRAMKTLISLCECTGWSGSALPANCIRALFVRCVTFVFKASEYTRQILFLLFTHWRLEAPKQVTGKQCRPWSKTTESGVRSGFLLFAINSTIFLKPFSLKWVPFLEKRLHDFDRVAKPL